MQTPLSHLPGLGPWLTPQRGLKAALGLALLGLSGALLVGSADPPAAPAPPVKTEKTTEKKAVEPADNSYCLVCHRNYEKEKLTVIHTAEGIGCEQCHGLSEKHSSDEDGITPPDVMFAKRKIAPYCLTCHSAEELRTQKEHKTVLALFVPAKDAPANPTKTCTDCHGKHRLQVRTRQWDKETRKLIKDDGVRMMDTNRPPSAAKP